MPADQAIIVDCDVMMDREGRKVQQSSSTGSVKNERVRLTLTIAVENIDFEAEAGVLRLKGTNVSESQHVKARPLVFFSTPSQQLGLRSCVVRVVRVVSCVSCHVVCRACRVASRWGRTTRSIWR